MSTLKEKNAALLAKLEETPNPGGRSIEVGAYLRDAQADKQISAEIEDLLADLHLLQE